MQPSERQELLTLLDAGREAFLHAVASVTDDIAGRSPGVGRWSILQCVEHVAVAEEYMLSQINRAKHSDASVMNEARESAIKRKGADRTKSVESPDVGKPTGRFVSLAEGVEHFLVCRARTLHLVHTCEDLRALLTDHPIIGPVNCHEMLLIMAVHPHRHAKQIHEIQDASIQASKTDPKRTIAEGYDRLGLRYGEWISRNPGEVRSWFLREALARIPAGASVLELGCGPGPAALELAAGRRYVGVDISLGQLAIAKERIPGGKFVHGDFTAINFPPGEFDAVVAFYVFNHVPRAEQAPTFVKIFQWLRSGGTLMLSLGVGESDDEIEEDWLGVPMFFASFDREMNERALADAGFLLELSELRSEIEVVQGDVRFQWVIARKP